MKQDLRLHFAVLTIAFACAAPVKAQIAQGGSYTLDQSTIASGGGQSSAGGAFTLGGTIGQPIARTRSTNSGLTVAGGFWAANQMPPTAASVTIGGRILTPDGRGLRNARITMTDFQGNARTAMSGAFGHFRFVEVEAGQTYILNVASKRYRFTPQILNVVEDNTDVNFTAFTLQMPL